MSKGRAAAAFAVLLAILVSAACGRKAPPEPRRTSSAVSVARR